MSAGNRKPPRRRTSSVSLSQRTSTGRDSHLQLLIDGLIAAITRERKSPDDEREKREARVQWCGKSLLAYADALGERDLLESGVLVPFSELDNPARVWARMCDELWELVSPDRSDMIDSVYALTDEELKALKVKGVDRLFEIDGENPGWYVVSIANRDGATTFLAMTASGGPREGVYYEFLGVFESPKEARQALAELGYLDEEDARLRM